MDKLATKRNYWYVLSLILVTPGVIALLLWGLNLGIDFTGGTIWELEFEQSVTTEEVRAVLSEHGFSEGTVQLSSDNDLTDNIAIIRIEALPQGSEVKEAIERSFEEEIGPFEELQISTVGSSVSSQISKRSLASRHVVYGQHGMGLAAAESSLQLNDRIAALAVEPIGDRREQ